jgi:hypothetical protein
MINNWWTGKEVEGSVPKFAWMVTGSGRDSSLFPQTQTGSGAHPPTYPADVMRSFLGDKAVAAWPLIYI